MKLRTQFLLGSAILTSLLLVVVGFFVYTEFKVQSLRDQREIAVSIERRANDLSYLSNQYLLYREQPMLARWESAFAALAADVGSLDLALEKHVMLIAGIKANSERLEGVFRDVALGAGGSSGGRPPNQDLSFLQASWDRLGVQVRQVVSDAASLHQALSTEEQQATRTTTILLLGVMVLIALLLPAGYFFIYRRTRGGLAALEAGTEIIGSGNLDFRIQETRRDEIGKLSRAFNKMTDDLRGVTASKVDLEEEIARRQSAESERERLLAEEQRLAAELASANEELRVQNESSQYSRSALLPGIPSSKSRGRRLLGLSRSSAAFFYDSRRRFSKYRERCRGWVSAIFTAPPRKRLK